MRRFVLVQMHETYRTAYQEALAHHQAVAEGALPPRPTPCPRPPGAHRACTRAHSRVAAQVRHGARDSAGVAQRAPRAPWQHPRHLPHPRRLLHRRRLWPRRRRPRTLLRPSRVACILVAPPRGLRSRRGPPDRPASSFRPTQIIHAGDDETVAFRASRQTMVQDRSFHFDHVFGPDACQGPHEATTGPRPPLPVPMPAPSPVLYRAPYPPPRPSYTAPHTRPLARLIPRLIPRPIPASRRPRVCKRRAAGDVAAGRLQRLRHGLRPHRCGQDVHPHGAACDGQCTGGTHCRAVVVKPGGRGCADVDARQPAWPHPAQHPAALSADARHARYPQLQSLGTSTRLLF